MEQERDPFDLLMNAGSDPGLWMLIGGPVLLLLVLVIVYWIIISARRRKERVEFDKVIEEESKGVGTPDATPEEDEIIEPYEVPEDLREPEEPVKPKLSVVPQPLSDVEDIRKTDRASWLKRLAQGLAKTRTALKTSIEGLLTGKTKIDQDVLERLHEALYRADIGVATADKLVDRVKRELAKDDSASWTAVSGALKAEALAILEKPASPATSPPLGTPWVILVVGVNGVGKTTTIGKLAAHFLAADKKVLLAAADTFRAAAIEQLQVWGQRLGVDVIAHKQGADPAAVAYDGVKAAISRKADVLLIDTAGRLHSKHELMAELDKINRAIGKDLPGAPHETWLVIDATTGQNAFAQVKAFKEVVTVSGLVVTKLDGTAKGGVIIGVTDQFGLPIRFVGVGEKASDLRGFEPKDFAESLF